MGDRGFHRAGREPGRHSQVGRILTAPLLRACRFCESERLTTLHCCEYDHQEFGESEEAGEPVEAPEPEEPAKPARRRTHDPMEIRLLVVQLCESGGLAKDASELAGHGSRLATSVAMIGQRTESTLAHQVHDGIVEMKVRQGSRRGQ